VAPAARLRAAVDFQLVRADFRDPMADAIVRVTNWLISPLRKVLPPSAKIDTATVVAVLWWPRRALSS